MKQVMLAAAVYVEDYLQTIRVFNVDPGDVNSDVPDSASDMMRVEVVIDWQGPGVAEPVMMTTVGWLAPR